MRFIFPQDGDCINKNDGTLTADYTVNGEADTEIAFANEYKAAYAEYLGAEKKAGPARVAQRGRR